MNYIIPKFLQKVNPCLSRSFYKNLYKDMKPELIYKTAFFGVMYFLLSKFASLLKFY